MLVHLDTLKYITESSQKLYDFQDNDIYRITHWLLNLESLARIFKIDNLIDYTVPLLKNEYLAWSYYQEFDSWETFKYDLINKIFPFRVEIGEQISYQVNQIKNLIENHDTSVFKVFDRFTTVMNELFKIIAPFEDWASAKYEILGEIDPLHEHIRKLREAKILLNQLYFKNLNDLTPEEEESLLNDDSSDAFWHSFKSFATKFLNSSLAFGSHVNRETRSVELVSISSLASKIMNNL